MKTTSKGGRPPIRAGQNKDSVITFRTRKALRASLAQSAAKSNCSISDEIERRLERSFVADMGSVDPSRHGLTTAELERKVHGRTSRAAGDRIRHWTNLGLLPVCGDAFPGTGSTRRYPEQAIERVRVLEDLALLRIDFAGRKRFIDRIGADPELLDAVRILKQALVSA